MVRITRKATTTKGRFVLYEDDIEAGEMTYSQAGPDKIIIDHTGVPDEHAGKGYGKKLVMAAVDFARENHLKILPLCPFAKKIFDYDSSLNDLRYP